MSFQQSTSSKQQPNNNNGHQTPKLHHSKSVPAAAASCQTPKSERTAFRRRPAQNQGQQQQQQPAYKPLFPQQSPQYLLNRRSAPIFIGNCVSTPQRRRHTPPVKSPVPLFAGAAYNESPSARELPKPSARWFQDDGSDTIQRPTSNSSGESSVPHSPTAALNDIQLSALAARHASPGLRISAHELITMVAS